MKKHSPTKNVIARSGATKQSQGTSSHEIATPHSLRSGVRNDILIPTGLPSDYKADERILSPIPGVVTRVFVKAGDKVAAGDPLLVIEAMKMKNTLRSGHELKVAAVHIKAGEVVKAGEILIEFGK